MHALHALGHPLGLAKCLLGSHEHPHGVSQRRRASRGAMCIGAQPFRKKQE